MTTSPIVGAMRPNYLLFFLFIPFMVNALSYEHLSKGFFTSIHVLTVDPMQHDIIPIRAKPRQPVSILASRGGAIAAINGGFWKENGDPAGVLKINGKWYGYPTKPRGAIGWTLGGQRVIIDRLLVLDNDVIPFTTPPEAWKELEHIVGGTPVLIQSGALIEDYSPEQTLRSFLTKRHPRTAVGIKKTGEWVFVVVDGRFFGLLGGMTMKELAHLMLHLGCVEALNLDGGSSSTMVLNGFVINRPSFGEASVSDAILILPSQKAL